MPTDKPAPARPRAVTIKHVAAEAGVSLQTVSRVINAGPNVREEIRTRVHDAINRLGYVPSLAARRMGGRRSYLLLALNDRDRTIAGWQSGDGTDWVDQMLLGGMQACAEHGYRLIFELVDTHSAHVEREITAALAAVHPDGVILTPPHGDNPVITGLLRSRNIPFARLGSTAPGAGFAIAMDDRQAAITATEHLLALGHRRIGFITGSADYALSGARLEGYRAAMQAAGLPPDPALVAPGDFTFASGVEATRRLLGLESPATAIIASSDQMSLAVVDIARKAGLAVPGELSIVSFDDTPIVRHGASPLTAIRQPIAAITARSAELLIGKANGQEVPDTPEVLPFELIVRASSAAPRG